MRIERIQLKNYKGFEDCTVDFHPKLNVFIGSNSSGKTSLLTACLKSLYRLTAKIARSRIESPELLLTHSDINYKATSSSIISFIADFPGFNTHIPIVLNTDEHLIFSEDGIKKDPFADFLKWYKERLSMGSMTVPIAKFYPANRWAIEYVASQSPPIFKISQLEAWYNIYPDPLSYSRFLTWFLENETNELLLQRDARDFGLQSHALRDVRQALNKAFEFMGYGPKKIKVSQIKRVGNSELIPALVLEDVDSKLEENLDSKSDGEKAIITLVADIAYNLSLAKDFTVDNDFLNSPGVVMIDEIETHLHPQWQRQIIPLLTSIFPSIQFFITTHSPQVVSSASSDSVFNIEDFQVHKINVRTKGEDSNSLLKYVFEATDRPQDYVNYLNEFDTLIEAGAPISEMEAVINKIAYLEREDSSYPISNLVSELTLRLEAYKFDKEHEANQ